jgi:hypothetical protein
MYAISRAGLYDAAHTSAFGTHQYGTVALSDSGVLLGTATRYTATGANGISLWRHENGLTTRLGYLDAAHTSTLGLQVSTVVSTGRPMNASGDVVGYSQRYSSTSLAGRTGWRYANGVYTLLGLTDAEHTNAQGAQSSLPTIMLDSGIIGGYSDRFQNSTDLGLTAWRLENGVYTRLGLTDAAHTRADGYRATLLDFMNESGHAAGTSIRFNGSTSHGGDAWLWHNGVYTPIGFDDAQHTSHAGTHEHALVGISDSGSVFGHTTSYVPYPQIGASAWTATANGTTRIGLFDAPHTSSLSGRQYAIPTMVNGAGHAAGRAVRFDAAGNNNGESAWIYDPATGTTARIGLFDAGHTSDTGFQFSSAHEINPQGEVFRTATRFSSVVSGGSSTWVYRNGQTILVGLYDPAHTDQNGGNHMNPISINARGDAVGSTTRWLGNLGYPSAWYFDDATSQTYPLEFSIGPTNESYTSVHALLDDGAVLGVYTRYQNGTSTNVPFWWSLADGLFDLTARIDGGLAGAGWDCIAGFSPLAGDSSVLTGTGRTTGSTVNRLFVLNALPPCDSISTSTPTASSPTPPTSPTSLASLAAASAPGSCPPTHPATATSTSTTTPSSPTPWTSPTCSPPSRGECARSGRNGWSRADCGPISPYARCSRRQSLRPDPAGGERDRGRGQPLARAGLVPARAPRAARGRLHRHDPHHPRARCPLRLRHPHAGADPRRPHEHLDCLRMRQHRPAGPVHRHLGLPLQPVDGGRPRAAGGTGPHPPQGGVTSPPH